MSRNAQMGVTGNRPTRSDDGRAERNNTMPENYQWVIPAGKYEGITHAFLFHGVCPYTGKTAEEWEKEGWRIVSDEELERLDEEYDRLISSKWEEITEQQYDNALNLMSPVGWRNGGFYEQEAYSGALHGFYQEYHGRYYTSRQPITASRESVLESLKNHLNANQT